MAYMSETIFQKQILHKLAGMEKSISYILGYLEDSKLSEEDKRAIKQAIVEERAGKLLSKKQVFA